MLESYQKAYQKILQNSSDGLQTLRAREFSQFTLQGLPKCDQENWKYTDISALETAAFNLVLNNQDDSNLSIAEHYLPDSHNLVFVNGYFSSQLSKLQALPDGVILTDIRNAWKSFPELVKPYLEKDIKQSLDSLNLALMTDGLFLYVPKNLKLKQPIQLLYLTTQSSQDCMQHLRNIILAEESAGVVLLENYVGLGDVKYFNNIVTQIYAKKNSQIEYYRCQNESREAYHIANIQVEQSANSQIKSYAFSVGSKLARDDLMISLNETGASCELLGLYLVHDKQHIDHHTRIDHHAAHGSSRENYKGILEGKATGVFNGKVIVHPGAQQTKAQQTNQNLLLSKTAEMNTKPELEIYADDVQCTHGATVGQMDEAALFYLQSRGIAEPTARKILTYAFMSEIIDAIGNPAIKQHIFLSCQRKLASSLRHAPRNDKFISSSPLLKYLKMLPEEFLLYQLASCAFFLLFVFPTICVCD